MQNFPNPFSLFKEFRGGRRVRGKASEKEKEIKAMKPWPQSRRLLKPSDDLAAGEGSFKSAGRESQPESDLSAGRRNDGSEPRILILDDEVSTRRVCTFALRGMGWRPEGEGSARAVLDRLKDGEAYDVIVLDYAMPEMDGLEFLAEFSKMADLTSRPPVLMASAHADGAVAKEAMRLGVWDFLAKPLTPDDIRRRVRRLINRPRLAEEGDPMAQALQCAANCEWEEARKVLRSEQDQRATLLRGLLHEMEGNDQAARVEFARAHWSSDWDEQGSEVWSELSRRFDTGQ